MLSKKSAISGEFDKFFDALSGPFRREPFDEYFLKQIKEWRLILGNSMMASNPLINMNTLNIAVQRILDRIIFLRICEDRSFEDYETLKHVSSFEELKSLFEAADKKYDSGLFELLEEDSISVEDNVLIDIFVDLYYPNNSYEFSVVDPYIIGQIYELFLDETLEYDEKKGVFCVEKPEAVDSQGAVNTPKNVTDIIVEKALDPLFTGKKIEDVKNYRIADICCGSGNFLISSFEYIVNFYINYYLENGKEDAIKRGDIYTLPGSTQFYLSYKMSYTADFLAKKRVVNDGKLQKYHIQDDHEAIIDLDTWNAVQQEIARREVFCKEHKTNTYAVLTETKPLSGKIICGECNNLYTRVSYTYRDGRKVVKWRCRSTNKVGGRRVCSNRYIMEDALIKLFIMSWNEIAGNYTDYLDSWNKNLEEGDELLRYKTRQLMVAAKKGKIKDLDGELMIMVMDYIKVFESGKLLIRFYNGTEFECETE